MKTKICLIASAFVLSFGSFAQTDKKEAKKENKKNISDSDLKDAAAFAVKAAEGGMFEVEAGKIAQTKGNSQRIKDLGKHMVDDHTKANGELKDLAAKKQITLPTKVSDKHQKELDELNKLSGTEFDKEYAKEMVKDHKEDVAMFEKEAKSGKDNEIKNWASEKVPTLRHHLSMAEEAHDAVKDLAKK
jgi:putative membrane protein